MKQEQKKNGLNYVCQKFNLSSNFLEVMDLIQLLLLLQLKCRFVDKIDDQTLILEFSRIINLNGIIPIELHLQIIFQELQLRIEIASVVLKWFLSLVFNSSLQINHQGIIILFESLFLDLKIIMKIMILYVIVIIEKAEEILKKKEKTPLINLIFKFNKIRQSIKKNHN